MADRRGSKRQRACLRCGRVKTFDDFVAQGCENCEAKLHLMGDQLRVEDYTSPTFEGLIAMMTPTSSWVARWQHIDKAAPGLYAIKVTGVPPSEENE